MIILLDLFHLMLLSSVAGTYNEDDIQHNMEQLRKTEWFQQYLKQQPYRDLLIFDEDVRKAIGKLPNKKLAKAPQRQAYQRVVTKALQQKIIVS